MSDDLNAVIADADAPVETVDTETPAVETEPVDSEPTDTATETVKQVPDKEPTTVPLKAVTDERHKRQALEEQVASQQAQLDALAQRSTPAKKEPVLVPEGLDLFGDPEGALKTVAGNLQQQHTAEMSALRADFQMQLSEAVARAKHDDFDLKVEAFKAEARKDPSLIQQARASNDAAEFIYRTGQRVAELSPFGGDLEKFKADAIAKYQAELDAKAADAAKGKVPKSLTQGPAQDSQTANPGPETLGEILGK